MEEEPGQITAAVGQVHLRFKKSPEPKGQQVFVKCTFAGRGAPIFLPPNTTTAVDGAGEPAMASEAAAAQQEVKSEPVDIVPMCQVVEGRADEGAREVAVVGDTDNGAEEKHVSETAGATTAVVVDMGFSVASTKFDLTEANLSMLDTTAIKMEVFVRGDGGSSETAVGAVTVRVTDVLRGKNEWTEELALGAYNVPEALDAATPHDTPHDPLEDAEGQDGREPLLCEEQEQAVDASPGLLEFGGSTSTMQVTMVTDDGTADYTLGAGSLWADGAQIVGVPEEWRALPPPETERSSWHDAIVQILAGQPRHEFSIWWGADARATEEKSEGLEDTPFPSMRLDGGLLSYVPDEDSVHASSTQDEPKEEGSTGAPTDPLKGGNHGDEGESAAPLDPPTGTWSVRFPSSQTRSFFLNRASIRALRRALAPDNGNRCPGDSGSTLGGDTSKATLLPVVFERRQLQAVTPVEPDQPSKAGKKGKKAAGKGAAPEQPPVPPENPWRCRAIVDLSPLVESVPTRHDWGDDAGRRSSTLLSGVATGDSPLRAELRAPLVLETPVEGVVDTGAGVEGNDIVAAPAATEGDVPGDANAETEKDTTPNEVETRTEQMKVANTTLFMTFALTRPLVKGPVRQETTDSVNDIFTPKAVGPWKPPRDVQAELVEELDGFVLVVLAEYARLFLEPGADGAVEQKLSAEDREKRLFYALNSGGLYHSFLERLKPRVQRVVRKRFGAVPGDAAERDGFISGLYAHLVEQAAVVLNRRIKNIEAKEIPSYVTTEEEKSLEENVEHLGVLANDTEARGAYPEASSRHEDRIEAATAAAAARADWRILLARAWEGYARFSLRGGRYPQRKESCDVLLDHATRCLEESLRVYHPESEESLAAATVLAAVAMEQGQLDRASSLLETSREKRLPKLEHGADGYETDQLAGLIPRRDLALACLLRDAMGDPSGARRNLFLAVLSSKREAAEGVEGAIEADDDPGAPRRTAVRVMHDACAWLLDLGLPVVARRAFAVGEESERLAVKKAKERSLPTRTPTSLRESSRRLESSLVLAEGLKAKYAESLSQDGNGEIKAPSVASSGEKKAEALAQEAVELIPSDPRPWQALAEACEAQGAVKASEAADAWAAVLDRLEDTWRVGTGPVPPLRVYMRLGALYNNLGRTDEAKACFLRGCRAWRAPGPWLGCGAACLRLEQWEEAEDALQHASRLDCNSSLVWGHLALLLLSLGEDRLQEADRALSQALHLGLADASLLREIGNCYVAVGRLEAAEGALRMSLAADINSSNGMGGNCAGGSGGGGGMGNPHTRRRLADVLSARNSTSQAVEEYRRVLESPSADESERQEVLIRCGNLLGKMGRGSELDQLREACSSRGEMRGTRRDVLAG